MKILSLVLVILSANLAAAASSPSTLKKSPRKVGQTYKDVRRSDYPSDDAFLTERCRRSGGTFDVSVGRCFTY